MTEQHGGKSSVTSDPKRASEAGKAGGQGSSNPKGSPQKASQAGQKSGQRDSGKSSRN